MTPAFHRFCIAGTQSGAGKTTVSLGLMAALRKRGFRVQPFKCGPDYIDTGHHRHAAGVRSRNLDSWMMPAKAVRDSFARGSTQADVAICEGVMGLFDGASPTGLSGSSAEIAKLIDSPVVLVVNARAMSRSIAALVAGFTHFEPGVNICGVIANQVGSEHHASLLREALASSSLPPLLGWLPRDPQFSLPERHLGLIADTEANSLQERIEVLAKAMERYIDLDLLLSTTSGSRPSLLNPHPPRPTRDLRLGLARDPAFHFYYEDNLDALRSKGVELIEFSPLQDASLPRDLNGLYFGGGFPEQFAQELSSNQPMLKSIRDFAQQDRPIFAECGGFMYLCREIRMPDGTTWPLSGIIPGDCLMREKRQRLGYSQATTRTESLFGPMGTRLRGHRFHWSEVILDSGIDPLFHLESARGIPEPEVGIQYGSISASYFHPHFASNPEALDAWVEALSRTEAAV